MSFDDLERVYDALAGAIDRAGEKNESVLLAKLAMLLAAESHDAERVLARIAEAERDLRDSWM